jgi:uridine phosphorylase
MTDTRVRYHIGFSAADLGPQPPTFALLCGAPERARRIARETAGVRCVKKLSEQRGLHSYLVQLDNGQRLLSATSGMGAPSLSIVVNELTSVGIRHIIRVGSCGALRADIEPGSVVISKGALCRQGAANDIAPPEYPAVADPFLTVALVEAARRLGITHHLGITASVDTFYEGQERTASSANPHLLRHLRGINREYLHLNILSYEMEAGTLFKMAGVYNVSAACVCAVLAGRTASEHINRECGQTAERHAIQVALEAVHARQSALSADL